MSKIYIFPGGGQKVRLLVELGHELTYEIDNNSDWPEKSGVKGSDSFTGSIWHKDFDLFKKMIEEWAGEEVELECIEEYNSRQEEEEDYTYRLKEFINERPSINISAFAKESGISHSLLKFILSGDRNLTESTWAKLEPVMNKYGYH